MDDFVAFVLFDWLGFGLFRFRERVNVEIVTALQAEPSGRPIRVLFSVRCLRLLLAELSYVPL